MRKIKLFAVLLTSVALMSSCTTTTRVLDFTVMSSKNVSINVKKDAPRVTGMDKTIKGAIDKAIESAGGGYDALIDGVISFKSRTAFYMRYIVEGTPIKTSEIKSQK